MYQDSFNLNIIKFHFKFDLYEKMESTILNYNFVKNWIENIIKSNFNLERSPILLDFT